MPNFPDPSSGYPDPSSGFWSQIPALMKVFIVIFAVLFVSAIVRSVVFTARRRRMLKNAGFSPMMASVQMQTRLANSALLSPPPGPGQATGPADSIPFGAAPFAAAPAARSVEERLAEVQSLHDRGVITSDELHEARLKIISG